MEKIKINMLSSADKVDGQGVGSAYLEQVSLVKEGAPELFDISINSNKKADILHIHTIDFDNYLKMLSTKHPKVAYVHFLPHTLDDSIKLPKPIFSVFKKYVINFYKAADYLVVVNPIFIEELFKYKISRDKIIYIPNYVNKIDFNKKSEKEVLEIRKKLNIDKNKFVVLGVGQIQTRKGVKDFIECANNLPDIQFVWCGGFSFGKITDGYEELKKIVDNPPANVKFLGIIPRTEMNDMYNMADLLFMPSYNELFPMSILESANSHTPLLLRDLDLYEDILFHKYVKGKDNKEFTKQIKKLSEDKEYYKKSEEYAKYISEFYDKEHVLNMWKDFYLKIYNKYMNEKKD